MYFHLYIHKFTRRLKWIFKLRYWIEIFLNKKKGFMIFLWILFFDVKRQESFISNLLKVQLVYVEENKPKGIKSLMMRTLIEDISLNEVLFYFFCIFDLLDFLKQSQ